MKIAVIFLTLLTLSGAAMCYSSLYPPLEKDEKLVNAITAKTAKKLRSEKGLILIGTGGGMMNDVEMLMMAFECRKVVDIAIARKLLVDSAEEYLLDINTNEEVRQYLHNYPFTAKNIEIAIYFRNPNGSTVAQDKLRVAAANEGELCYYMHDPEKDILKIIKSETYEEALKAVDSKMDNYGVEPVNP